MDLFQSLDIVAIFLALFLHHLHLTCIFLLHLLGFRLLRSLLSPVRAEPWSIRIIA
jgi:hypothetical protein